MADQDEHSRETRPLPDQSTASDGSGSSPFFPDIPNGLIPKSIDGTRLSSDETQQAREAVALIGKKMSSIIGEYADGNVNQAQFQAIYTRYCEQKVIIERILDQDRDAIPWESEGASGSTSLLRRMYAAHVVGQMLVETRSGDTIRLFGVFDLKADLLVPILSTLIERSIKAFDAGTKSTQIEGGRWLTFVPGELSASVTIFSQEPSGQQLRALVDSQRDFERANLLVLQAGVIDPEKLVYPQVALFQ